MIGIGRSTTTGDPDGDILELCSVTNIDTQIITSTLQRMVGVHEFPVPLYSAIKVDGKPLYWYAHNNKTPPRIPTKTMQVLGVTIHAITTSENMTYVDITVDVGSGTYIRTIAEECGRLLGYPAMLTSLRRISVGEYTINDDNVIADI